MGLLRDIAASFGLCKSTEEAEREKVETDGGRALASTRGLDAAVERRTFVTEYSLDAAQQEALASRVADKVIDRIEKITSDPYRSLGRGSVTGTQRDWKAARRLYDHLMENGAKVESDWVSTHGEKNAETIRARLRSDAEREVRRWYPGWPGPGPVPPPAPPKKSAIYDNPIGGDLVDEEVF